MKTVSFLLFSILSLNVYAQFVPLKGATIKSYDPSSVRTLEVVSASQYTQYLINTNEKNDFSATHYLVASLPIGRGVTRLMFPLDRTLPETAVETCRDVLTSQADSWLRWAFISEFFYSQSDYINSVKLKLKTVAYNQTSNGNKIHLVKDIIQCKYNNNLF